MKSAYLANLVTAFKSPALPCNPIPFATAIADMVRDHGTSWIQSDQAKSLLYCLNQMAYGQLYTIDSISEYERLTKLF